MLRPQRKQRSHQKDNMTGIKEKSSQKCERLASAARSEYEKVLVAAVAQERHESLPGAENGTEQSRKARARAFDVVWSRLRH